MELGRFRKQAPRVPRSMTDLRKTAAVSLEKNGLRAPGTGNIAVYLVLDHSGSMMNHYRDGAVQQITEQVLALAAETDDDGYVPAFYFETGVRAPEVVSLDPSGQGSSYRGWVDRTHPHVPWGATDYARAIGAVTLYHRQQGGQEAGLCVFQTDGSPYTPRARDAREDARQALRDASHAAPGLFFAFVGFGPRHQVDFLFELDTISGRARDNASAFHAAEPLSTPDAALYDGVLGEFSRDFLTRAR